MNGERFIEALSKRAAFADCPEEFWGAAIFTISNGVSKSRMENIISLIQQAVANKTGNSNEDFNRQMLLSRALLFQTWTLEKIEAETYGDEIKFRLELNFTVESIGNKKKPGLDAHRFILTKEGSKRYSLKEIPATWFSGELHNDKYELHDEERRTYARGIVEMYGTHGRGEYFTQKEPSHNRVDGLMAGSLTLGHGLTIRTWEYGSVSEFIKWNRIAREKK